VALVASGLSPAGALAHGWHNAALTTASLNDWLADVRQAIPDLMQRMNTTELRSGEGLEALRKRGQAAADSGGKSTRGPKRPAGTIQSELTPRQQALLGRKADDCLEALAFMRPENIYPDEFPNFPMEKLDEYRATAAKLLRMMGRAGVSAVVNELRAELMGNGRSNNATDYALHRDYFNELFKILEEGADQGQLSAEDEQRLREAASGRKPPPYDALAAQVLQTLDKLAVNARSLPESAQLLAGINDPREKAAMLGQIRRKLPEAKTSELLTLLQAEPDRNLSRLTLVELDKRFARASVLELLQAQAVVEDGLTARHAAAELAARSPKYAEVREDLPKIVEFALDPASPAAEAAQRQLANAFQRAPVRECLIWLDKGDDALDALIWRQIDGRIARADRDRLTGYRNVALESLLDDAAPPGQQQAALDLLQRLDASLVVGPLVDALPKLPRERWPAAGDVLRKLTKQDFGPRAGDGAAELSAEIKQWRTWIEQHPAGDQK
jgi:hypothetical protein